MYSPIVMYAVCLNAAIKLNLEQKNGETGVLALTDQLIEREYVAHGYRMLPEGKTRKDVDAWQLLNLVQREGPNVLFFKPTFERDFPNGAASGIWTAVESVKAFQASNADCVIRGW